MKNGKELDNSDRLSYILLGVVVILGLLTLYLTFDSIAINLYGKDNPKAKGELLTTCLSIIGGIAVVYGLYLNSKRIKEQTRQNDIAVGNNNDKRFGDAIGYLNSDNTGIVIGGVYILNQLAKEDKRYIPIVANIYLDLLSETYTLDLSDRKTKLIFESIFTDYFNTQRVVFRGLVFKGPFIKTINNKVFENCMFEGVTIHNVIDSAFINSELHGVHLMNVNKLSVIESSIDNCLFSNNCNELEKLQMYKCGITASTIGSTVSINMLSMTECYLKDYLHIASPKILNANIDTGMEKLITIATDKLQSIKPLVCTTIPYKDYDAVK